MIFNPDDLYIAVNKEIIPKEKCKKLMFFLNTRGENFSKEDLKLLNKINRGGRLIFYSDTDLLNAKREGLITREELLELIGFLERQNKRNKLTNPKFSFLDMIRGIFS